MAVIPMRPLALPPSSGSPRKLASPAGGAPTAETTMSFTTTVGAEAFAGGDDGGGGAPRATLAMTTPRGQQLHEWLSEASKPPVSAAVSPAAAAALSPPAGSRFCTPVVSAPYVGRIAPPPSMPPSDGAGTPREEVLKGHRERRHEHIHATATARLAALDPAERDESALVLQVGHGAATVARCRG